MPVTERLYFPILYFISLVDVSLVPEHSVFITLEYDLSLVIVRLPTLAFLLRITLAVWGLLKFLVNFTIVLSSSMKDAIGILMEIILNLQIKSAK